MLQVFIIKSAPVGVKWLPSIVYFLFFLLAANRQLSSGRGLLIGNQPK